MSVFRQLPSRTIPIPVIVALGVVLCAVSLAIVVFTVPSLRELVGLSNELTEDQLQVYRDMLGVQEDASKLIVEGKRADAATLLEERIKDATDPIVKAELMLSLARTRSGSDVAASVALYKDIVADLSFQAETRAAAAEEMGLLYTMALVDDTGAVTAAVFSGEPYASFHKDVSDEEAYLNLFAYADSIYPRIYASGYRAVAHARSLAEKNATGSLSDEDRRKGVEAVNGDLRSLEDALTAATNGANDFRPLAYIQNAQALLYLEGMSEDPDKLDDAIIVAVRQGMLFSSSYMSGLIQNQIASEMDVSAFDYNGSYFGQGYLWEQVLAVLVEQKNRVDGGLVSSLADGFVAFLESPLGAVERARVADSDSSVHGLVSSLAVIAPQLAAYLKN